MAGAFSAITGAVGAASRIGAIALPVVAAGIAVQQGMVNNWSWGETIAAAAVGGLAVAAAYSFVSSFFSAFGKRLVQAPISTILTTAIGGAVLYFGGMAISNNWTSLTNIAKTAFDKPDQVVDQLRDLQYGTPPVSPYLVCSSGLQTAQIYLNNHKDATPADAFFFRRPVLDAPVYVRTGTGLNDPIVAQLYVLNVRGSNPDIPSDGAITARGVSPSDQPFSKVQCTTEPKEYTGGVVVPSRLIEGYVVGEEDHTMLQARQDKLAGAYGATATVRPTLPLSASDPNAPVIGHGTVKTGGTYLYYPSTDGSGLAPNYSVVLDQGDRINLIQAGEAPANYIWVRTAGSYANTTGLARKEEIRITDTRAEARPPARRPAPSGSPAP